MWLFEDRTIPGLDPIIAVSGRGSRRPCLTPIGVVASQTLVYEAPRALVSAFAEPTIDQEMRIDIKK